MFVALHWGLVTLPDYRPTDSSFSESDAMPSHLVISFPMPSLKAVIGYAKDLAFVTSGTHLMIRAYYARLSICVPAPGSKQVPPVIAVLLRLNRSGDLA